MALAGRVLLCFGPDEVRPRAGIIAYRGSKDENRNWKWFEPGREKF
jgi:hypothetical protein